MVAPPTPVINDIVDWLTVPEIAVAVGIDPQMVRYWIKPGELPARRPGDPVYHVKRSHAPRVGHTARPRRGRD